MSEILRYSHHQSDPTQPVPSDWVPSYGSGELYSATPANSTEGARHVRDLHVKLENVLKGADGRGGSGGSGSAGVDQRIQEVVQQMLMVNVAMQERYGMLDLADLLKKNKHVKVRCIDSTLQDLLISVPSIYIYIFPNKFSIVS